MADRVIVLQGELRVVRLAPQPVRLVRVPAPGPVRVIAVAQQGRPGGKGDPGERGLPGSVAGTLPWAQITDKPLIGAYTYVQATAAAIWTINHNLDTPPVHISVQDLTGSGLDGYDVDHTSQFQTRLTFSPPAAGTARLS